MQITVSGLLNQFHRIMQGVLFPALQEQLGPLSDKHQQLVLVLSLIQIEAMVASWSGGVGRPARIGGPWHGPLWPKRCST